MKRGASWRTHPMLEIALWILAALVVVFIFDVFTTPKPQQPRKK
jgi:hypothetical protein